MNSILKEKPLNDIRSYIYKVYLILLFYFHQIVVLSKHFTIFWLQNGGINLIALYPLDDSLRQIHASLVAKWEAPPKLDSAPIRNIRPFRSALCQHQDCRCASKQYQSYGLSHEPQASQLLQPCPSHLHT